MLYKLRQILSNYLQNFNSSLPATIQAKDEWNIFEDFSLTKILKQDEYINLKVIDNPVSVTFEVSESSRINVLRFYCNFKRINGNIYFNSSSVETYLPSKYTGKLITAQYIVNDQALFFYTKYFYLKDDI